MNRLSVQPKTALSGLQLSCSHRSHQFKPLRASRIDFPSHAVSIHSPHYSIFGLGWAGVVVRCEPSPGKWCRPQLSLDSTPPSVCVHPFHPQWVCRPIFPSRSPGLNVSFSLVPEWYSAPALASISPSLLFLFFWLVCCRSFLPSHLST